MITDFFCEQEAGGKKEVKDKSKDLCLNIILHCTTIDNRIFWYKIGNYQYLLARRVFFILQHGAT